MAEEQTATAAHPKPQPTPKSREAFDADSPTPPGGAIHLPQIVTVGATLVAADDEPIVAIYVEGLGRFALGASHALNVSAMMAQCAHDAINESALVIATKMLRGVSGVAQPENEAAHVETLRRVVVDTRNMIRQLNNSDDTAPEFVTPPSEPGADETEPGAEPPSA